MARRLRPPKLPGIVGAPRPPKHNQTNRNNRESRQREKMLDQSKANFFRYECEDILKNSGVAPEVQSALIQTMWAKGSRDSVVEARVFLNDKVKEKVVDAQTQARLLNAMDRYTTWR